MLDDCGYEILASIDRLAGGKPGVVVPYAAVAREVGMSEETVKSIVAEMPRDFINAAYDNCSLTEEGREQFPP